MHAKDCIASAARRSGSTSSCGNDWVVGATGDPRDRQGRRSVHVVAWNISAGNSASGSARRVKVQHTPIRFRDDAAQAFDARCLSWQIPIAQILRSYRVDLVGEWPIAKRRVIAMPPTLVLLRNRKIGEIRPDPSATANWYLHATIEVPEVTEATPSAPPINGFLGVDMGIVNIATTSDRRASRPVRA